MNAPSSAPNIAAQPEPLNPGQPAFSPYYSSGEQLRAKHQGTTLRSGRRFETWALDLLPLRPDAIVLDAGCGWGRFTWPLIEKHALASANITCCDSSLGMLQTAAQEADRCRHCPRFVVADIQALPFPANHYDGAMANQVLYHLPDIPAGISELARVVKADGWLLAATNSDEVSVPVLDFHYAALDRLAIDYVAALRSPFSMENGFDLLKRRFRNVEQVYFEDETLYHSADDFVSSYKTIGRYRNLLAQENVSEEAKRQLPVLVRQQAEETMREVGVLRAPVRLGAFVCGEPKT